MQLEQLPDPDEESIPIVQATPSYEVAVFSTSTCSSRVQWLECGRCRLAEWPHGGTLKGHNPAT